MIRKITLKEQFRRTVAGNAMMMATMAKVVNERYGPEGVEALQKALEDAMRKIIPSIASDAGARVGEGDLTDWAKVEDFLCETSGMDWEIEITPGRGVLRVKSCPLAQQYRKTFPEFCQMVLIGVERAIASTINSKLEAGTTGKYLPKGDDCCEIICHFKHTK